MGAFGWLCARSCANGWCPLKRAFLCALRPPTQPTKTPTRARTMWRAGRGGHSLRRSPLPSRTIPIRPPPLYGENGCCRLQPQRLFVRCRGLLAPVRCAVWLRSALPRPGGYAAKPQTWRLIFNKPPYLPLGAGGAARRGAPTPCARLPAPPMPMRCARSLVMRPVCASLAGLLILARLSAPLPPFGRLGGSPLRPRPHRSRAPGRFAPIRALSPPSPWARYRAPPCFGGLLWRAALGAARLRSRQWLGPLSLPPALRAVARSFVPP